MEDIKKELEKFSEDTRKKLLIAWNFNFINSLKEFSKKANPFKKTKAKPLFGAARTDSTGSRIKVFGMRPNVAEDPMYTSLPTSKRKPSQVRYNIFINGKWRSVKTYQEHWESFPKPIFTSKQIASYFIANKKLFGITAETYSPAKRKHEAVPMYSTRTLSEIAYNSPELSEMSREAFEKALEELQ